MYSGEFCVINKCWFFVVIKLLKHSIQLLFLSSYSCKEKWCIITYEKKEMKKKEIESHDLFFDTLEGQISN